MDGFNFVEYLQKMLKTYASFDGRVLDILLNLAACYHFIENDLLNASKCYLQAFEKYPNSKLYQVCDIIFYAQAVVLLLRKFMFDIICFSLMDVFLEEKQIFIIFYKKNFSQKPSKIQIPLLKKFVVN